MKERRGGETEQQPDGIPLASTASTRAASASAREPGDGSLGKAASRAKFTLPSEIGVKKARGCGITADMDKGHSDGTEARWLGQAKWRSVQAESQLPSQTRRNLCPTLAPSRL